MKNNFHVQTKSITPDHIEAALINNGTDTRPYTFYYARYSHNLAESNTNVFHVVMKNDHNNRYEYRHVYMYFGRNGVEANLMAVKPHHIFEHANKAMEYGRTAMNIGSL